MEQYIVSARKYRPADWGEVIGQQAITETLQRSIDTNHLAQAYLFCGPRGVGKTTCARIFAKAINQGQDDPDNDFAFNIFELDAASNNSVDDIRQLNDQVRIPPQTGKYKVYIIDEVHMLSTAAFNAFLKTLEEPPSYAVFILATTEKHKIIPTILSRCQIYDFHRIEIKDMVSHMKAIAAKENVQYEEEALHIIADKADGAMRDSLSIFDQLVSFTNSNLTTAKVRESLNVLDRDFFFRFTDFSLKGDIPGSILLFHDVLKLGFDAQHFMTGLASHFRDLMVAGNPQTLPLLQASDTAKQTYVQQAANTTSLWLVDGLNILSKADSQIRSSKNPRLLTEITLMNLCAASVRTEQKKNDEQPASISSQNLSANPPQPPHLVPVTSKPIESINVSEDNILTESQSAQYSNKPEKTELPTPETKSTKTTLAKNIAGGLGDLSISGLKKTTLAPTPHEQQEPAESSAKTSAVFQPIAENITEVKPVTREQLMVYWRGFADVAKTSGKLSLYATLTNHEPELDGEQISFNVDNAVQEHDMNECRQDLVDHLSSGLKRNGLRLQINKIERNDRQEAYTPQEKYKRMAEKNPNIEKLRQQFDLDIDFG